MNSQRNHKSHKDGNHNKLDPSLEIKNYLPLQQGSKSYNNRWPIQNTYQGGYDCGRKWSLDELSEALKELEEE